MRADTILPNVTGARLQSVQKKDYTWFFGFTDSVRVTTESPWRLLFPDGIVVTSEDHGHQFGLPSPVDASAKVSMTLKKAPIRTSRIDASTGDLFLSFPDGTLLQFLQMSSGYEAWSLCVGDNTFICTGGGEINTFNEKQQRS
jgi:hypothetical protein